MKEYLAKRYYGITSASIEKYLLLTGWKREEDFINKRMIVFCNREDSELRIAIPASEEFDDFFARLEELVRTLSIMQSRSESVIIDAIRSAYTDRMQFRIIYEATKNGKLPLSYAAKCLEGLRDLVLYAACAEENAQPVCSRTNNSALSSLERFQFGQTGVGSYIFNIEVPVADEENEQLYLLEFASTIPEPTEHRIVKRINTAIRQVNSVVNRELEVSELVAYAYKDGITANMCNALAKLRPLNNTDIEIEATIKYAGVLTHSFDELMQNTLDSGHFMFFEEISRRYKDYSLVEDVKLIGTIRMLSRDSVSTGEEPENTVRLLSKVDNKMRSITMHLSPQNHISACDAYRDDKEVEVTGTIDKSGKRWFFSDISDFVVLG